MIGDGAAGLPAAIDAGRYLLKTLRLEGKVPGGETLRGGERVRGEKRGAIITASQNIREEQSQRSTVRELLKSLLPW